MSRSMKEYLLQEAERRNVDLAVMYGQTEATARISSFFLNEHPDKIDSVGTVIPGGKLTISLADENGCGRRAGNDRNIWNERTGCSMGTTCVATLSDPAWQCEVYSDRGAATYDEWKVGL